MSRRYTGSNPLDAVPQPEWQREPVQRQPEPPEIEFDYDPNSKSNIMARKAAAEIRRKYRIEAGDVRAMGQHDREMRHIWHELMEGTYQPPASTMTLTDPRETQAAWNSSPTNPANWR